MPLEDFAMVWENEEYVALGYEGPFRIKFRWFAGLPYDVREDDIYITFSHLQAPFVVSDYLKTPSGNCVAWFLSYEVYGYLAGYPPEAKLIDIWTQARKVLERRIPGFQDWPMADIGLRMEAYLLRRFGKAAVGQALTQEWEALRAYLTTHLQYQRRNDLPCP